MSVYVEVPFKSRYIPTIELFGNSKRDILPEKYHRVNPNQTTINPFHLLFAGAV